MTEKTSIEICWDTQRVVIETQPSADMDGYSLASLVDDFVAPALGFTPDAVREYLREADVPGATKEEGAAP